MKILDLPLKKKWYEMIESGEKNEEYREIKPYWSKRLLGFDAPLFSQRYGYQHANQKGYTHVRFRYGYTRRTMLFKIDSITVDVGNPDWGAPSYPVFIIKFHEHVLKAQKGGGMLNYVSVLDQPLKERIKAVVKECLIESIHTNELEEIEKEIEKL